MGEWIRDLSTYDYGIKIELNAPMEKSGKNPVHIQNKIMRIEMSDVEFGKFAAEVIKSGDLLRAYKRVRDE